METNFIPGFGEPVQRRLKCRDNLTLVQKGASVVLHGEKSRMGMECRSKSDVARRAGMDRYSFEP